MIDCAARTKNGQPPQSTTGVASSELDPRARPGERERVPRVAGQHVRHGDEHERRRERGAHHEPPRHVAELGVLGVAAAAAERGSSAMPQIGQLPGALAHDLGCMGQVHSSTTAPLAAPPPREPPGAAREMRAASR